MKLRDHQCKQIDLSSMHIYQNKWLLALKGVLPVYLITHGLFVLLTLFSALFILSTFSSNSLPLSTLWKAWEQWDTAHYRDIAKYGYDQPWRAAFFPLFPLLERYGGYLTQDPFIAGLIISNVAGLIGMTVFYQLVKEDFGEDRATNAVLYFSIFPPAFFLAAAYTESLFLCLVWLSFYQIRRGSFWLAGLFGLFAGLTRSPGIFLLFPLAYQMVLRRTFRFDILSLGLIPLGAGLYSAYCYRHFGDALAWLHAQNAWKHELHWPWDTLIITLKAIRHDFGLLSVPSLHNVLDLVSVLFVLSMTILMLVGPYKLRREHLAYAIYAVPLLLFFLSVPIIMRNYLVPLQSMPRFMLEVFPVFVVAGNLSKHRWFHDGYLVISGGLLSMSCLLFLVGRWMV
jgi:Gpi18-like mannosyltransferase